MIELLKRCGFEVNEIQSELPRVKKAFDKLGITIEDIERGKQRLDQYYDMRLQSVRKAFGFFVRDVVNMVLAREDGKKKILYGFMSPGFGTLGSALFSKSEEIYVAVLPGSFQFVLGFIFDKIVPMLEAAEHKWLKPGKVSHCANVKTIVGLLALDLVPRPDLLVTSGQLCDTAPKTFDLIQELYDIPTCCYDICQDREFKEYPDSRRLMELYAMSLRRLTLRMQEVVGFEITDDMLQESINARSELGKALMRIQDLIESSDPLPISPTHEILWYNLSGLPLSADKLRKAVAILNTLYEELQNRVNRGEGVVEKGAPRILSVNPPHFADPRWEHLVCELGIALVASEPGFFPMHGTRYLDIDQEKPKDPYKLHSQWAQNSLHQSLSARTAIIIEACKRLKVDGVLAKYHVGCRTTVGDALIIKDAIARELGIPVLLLGFEGFDPRDYNEKQYKRKIESFQSVLSGRTRKYYKE
jgi:benzoyl-CoA reductase/2-hydroxyglutaryl-CoA dehydratase subunit BcrC/BadD/HgdB